jgi:GntR family transcriptional regulator, transcriptional repressor for pyruvate dehydrogenase complex
MMVADVATRGRRVSRAEQLSRQLEAEIVQGALAPGRRIATKAQLREHLGVGVATINETVRLLQSRGVVAVRPGPGGGLFVATPQAPRAYGGPAAAADGDSRRREDCAVVRWALEPLVCRAAAHAPVVVRQAVLHGAVRRLVGAQPAARRAAGWALHRAIAALCANEPLRRAYVEMVDVLEGDPAASRFGGRAQDRIAVHRELALAVAAGGGARLEAAVRRHAAVSDGA